MTLAWEHFRDGPAMTDQSTAPPPLIPAVDRPGGENGLPTKVSGPGPAGPAGRPEAPVRREARFINRELSWLDLGDRLLTLAGDARLPLFERVKLLAIFSGGLDEFFQVRVAGLEDQVAAGLHTRSPDGMRPAEQLAAITSRVTTLVETHSRIFQDLVSPAMAGAGLVIADWHTLAREDRDHLLDEFNQRIFPILTPLAVDQGHPFPYISNLSLNLVVRLDDPASGEERIARVKIPPVLPRLVALPDGHRFVPLEQVVAAHLDALFPGMAITEHHAFRVTRNADLSVEEDEAGDLLAAVELELHRRRFGQAVRLEVAAGISADLLDKLIAEVDVPEGNVYLFDVPIDLAGFRPLVELERPDLAAPPWTPGDPSTAGRHFGPLLPPQRVRRPGPPPLRVVRRVGRGLLGPGVRRPRRAGHQADPLPDRGRQPGGGLVDPRLTVRQAGHRRG
jgi:polyphosphate kinase 1